LTASATGAAVRPRVSIGLPVYNGAAHLERALDSLLNQTFTDLEIIVSDNASTDATGDMARQYAAVDSRVRYVQGQVNRGLAWNHRRVVELAQGDYFMFAAHDDWFAPEYVARCVAELDQDPTVAYVMAENVLVDESGELIGIERARQRLNDPRPSIRFWDVLVVAGGMNGLGMTRRPLLETWHRLRPVPRGERVALAELALAGPFRLLEGDLYFRRVHARQTSVLRRSRRAEAAVLDPRRRIGLLGSAPVLIAEYAFALLAAIIRARITPSERLRCLGAYARWLVGHVPGLEVHDPRAADVEIYGPGSRRLPEGRAGIGY